MRLRASLVAVAVLSAWSSSAAAQPSPFEIKGPNAHAAGRVIDQATNMPIADARIIFAFRGRTRLQATTDQDGRFAYDELEPGPYRLTVVQKPGYAPLDPTTLPTFWVVAGETVALPTVSLQKGGVVTGRVLDTAGTPLAGVMERAGSPEQLLAALIAQAGADCVREVRVRGEVLSL